jgi:hypothetical protein
MKSSGPYVMSPESVHLPASKRSRSSRHSEWTPLR